jgi:hypothetical protein
LCRICVVRHKPTQNHAEPTAFAVLINNNTINLYINLETFFKTRIFLLLVFIIFYLKYSMLT